MGWCILVSFNMTNPEMIKRIRDVWKRGESNEYRGRSRKDTQSIKRDLMGGAIALLHPKTLRIFEEISIRTPNGMVFNQEMGLLVGCDHWVKIVKGGKIVATLDNPMFNDIHGLSPSLDGNLWVCSTGIDALIKIDPKNPEKILDSWLATENSYTDSPIGERVVQRDICHQGVEYSTLFHTTHINSLLEREPGKILATLFHQGELVEIDLKTGETTCLVREMKNPHSVHRTSFGFICSDTRNGRIVLLNKKLEQFGEISTAYLWIQDAIELPNKQFLVVDNQVGKLVCIDMKGREQAVWNFGSRNRNVGALLLVSFKEAREILGNILMNTLINTSFLGGRI